MTKDELITVNVPAREQRLAFEKELENHPYKNHLYQEQEFEKLIFMELFELNRRLKTSKLIQEDTSVASMMFEHIEGPPRERDEDLAVLHEDQIDGGRAVPKKPVRRKK